MSTDAWVQVLRATIPRIRKLDRVIAQELLDKHLRMLKAKQGGIKWSNKQRSKQ